MEELHVSSQIREGVGKSKVSDIRNLGFIPAVIYGKGKKNQNLKVLRQEIKTLLHGRRAENIVFKLKVENQKEKKEHTVIIKEIQYHPVTDVILHIDFNEISLTKAIKVKVPIVAKGEPIGIKQEGGSLEHLLWEIDVECLPTQIPDKFEVDVSNLKIGDAIHISELVVPDGIKVLHDPSTVMLSVAAPVKVEAPVAEAVAVEGEAEKQEPEVIKKEKKTEEEEAEGKEPEAKA